MPNTDAPTIEEIRDRKIKIFSSVNPSRVIVIQDGNAADADVDGPEDVQIDDGFRDGWSFGWAAYDVTPEVWGMTRMAFDLVRLDAGKDGREFVFEVQDFTAWNSLGISPNDRVEFSMNVGAQIPVGGSWPSWHAGDLAADGQEIVFYGFIDELKRVDDSQGGQRFEVRCVDPIKWSNRMKVQQSIAEGVTIPWAIFNVDDPADLDRIISIKRYDDAEPVVTDRFRQGNALDPGTELMALGEILDYLQNAYQAELFARGIVDGASELLFDAGELATLTDVPPKTVFENMGFGDAVRQLIKANLPDHEVTCDPRSKKWRIRALNHDLLSSGIATIQSVDTAKTKWVVDDASIFAAAGDGSSFRIQSQQNLYQSEVRNVEEVVTGGPETVEADVQTGWEYAAGDLILPMFSEADRPPLVAIDLAADAPDSDLIVDLNGVYTAVSIVGRRQKRERKKITHTVPGDPTIGNPLEAQIRAGYQVDMEAETNYFAHRNRRIDRGPAPDYPGIEIDEIETIGTAPNEFTRIYFSEQQSAFENDHAIPSGGATAEWVGAAMHFLTHDGDDIEAANISAIITFFNRAGWMDGPTNSIRRFRVDLDRDVLASGIPLLKDEVNDGAPDLFQMSQAEIHKPANPNRRWAVGRFWQVESTSVADDNRLVDSSGCYGYVEYPSVYTPNHTIQQTAIPAEQTSEAPRTFQEIVDYHGLNPSNPLTGGVPRAWFIEPPEPPPTFEELCAQLPPPPPPPRSFTIELDKITQEVRSVRVPGAGFRGLAWYWHKHAEELFLITDQFEHESQEDQFEVIASAIWRKVSSPHYTGRVPLNGVLPWIRMIDLGFRVRFGTGNTGFAQGAVTEQSRFWGLVQNVSIDFRGRTANVAFESTGFADTLKQDLFERQFVSETAELKTLRRTPRPSSSNSDAPRPGRRRVRLESRTGATSRFRGRARAGRPSSSTRRTSSAEEWRRLSELRARTPRALRRHRGRTHSTPPTSSRGTAGPGPSSASSIHPAPWSAEQRARPARLIGFRTRTSSRSTRASRKRTPRRPRTSVRGSSAWTSIRRSSARHYRRPRDLRPRSSSSPTRFTTTAGTTAAI